MHYNFNFSQLQVKKLALCPLFSNYAKNFTYYAGIMHALCFSIPIMLKITPAYRIIQKFQGTKLSRLDHHVSIRGKTFTFASV